MNKSRFLLLLSIFALSQITMTSAVSTMPQKDFSQIADAAVKSVVNISSERVVRTQNHLSPFFNDPFFRHFFGESAGNPFGIPQERRQKSLGSGVLVSSSGYILTNNHVVPKGSEVTVYLNDRTELKAKVIGTDPPTDLALLQVTLPRSIRPIPFGNSDSLRLAEPVLAIGSPFGLGGTVTQGIVSAKGRANVGIADYEDFIQTDAAINPGNSGGALINLQGELVGINTAIYSKSGGYQGIGFAIPSDMAQIVMKQLIQNGEVIRGWLGVRYQDVSPEIAKAYKMKRVHGAIVTGVVKNGPAHKAGVVAGDIIAKFNGDEIKHSGQLSRLLSETPISSQVKLLVRRDETTEKMLTATLERRPDQKNSFRTRAPRK